MADNDDRDFPCSGQTSAGPRRQCAHYVQSARARHPTLGTTEEFLSWQVQADQNGLQGLRATRVQEYRGRGRREARDVHGAGTRPGRADRELGLFIGKPVEIAA